jgi:hypothetical protein
MPARLPTARARATGARHSPAAVAWPSPVVAITEAPGHHHHDADHASSGQAVSSAIELDAFAKMAPTAQARDQLHKLARHYARLVGRRPTVTVDCSERATADRYGRGTSGRRRFDVGRQKACEIRLRAERRAGQMLGEMDKAKGAREGGTSQGSTPSRATSASPKPLASLGIFHDQSSRWQRLAALRDFEAQLR